jgi:ABC-type transport system involved in cytochrome bd biosynthesis fused ATPase/permease subunit
MTENTQMNTSKNCKQQNYGVYFGLNLFTHATFLFIILGLFFLLYAFKLIENAVNNEFSKLVNEVIEKNINKISDEDMNLLSILSNNKNVVLTNLSNYFGQEDKVKSKHNKNISDGIYTIMVFLVLIIIIVFAVSKAYCGNIKTKKILLENVIIFTFVGIVEILFFTFIIKKFIPFKPSFLSVYLKESIEKNLK